MKCPKGKELGVLPGCQNCTDGSVCSDMYEALKAIDEYLSAPHPENMKLKQIAADKLVSALAKAEERS